MAFHSKDGLFFERWPDGSVQVTKRVRVVGATGIPTGASAVVEQWHLDPDTWASVVASVSAAGEDHPTWTMAREFHMGTHTPAGDVARRAHEIAVALTPGAD